MELRARLADAERRYDAALDMAPMEVSAPNAAPPDTTPAPNASAGVIPRSLPDRILEHMAKHPGADFGADDFAEMPEVCGDATISTVRSALQRLHRERHLIAKSRRGRFHYPVRTEAPSVAPTVPAPAG